MALKEFENKKTPWEGLWQQEGEDYYSSTTINLAKLKEFKGNVKIYMKKNKYFKKGTKRPNFIFSIQDSNGLAKDLVIEDIEDENQKLALSGDALTRIKEEYGLYSREEVEQVKYGACMDGQNGYDPYDLRIEDYIS